MRKSLLNCFNVLCEHPRKALFFYVICSIVFWTLQCSLLQNVLGLDVIEVLTWGHQGMVWGHVKHPPFSGWLAALFRLLFCGHDWGMYLAAQLAIMGGLWFTYLTGRRFFHDEFRAVTAALLLCFLHYYTPSEIRFCTYPLAMLLKPLIVWCFTAAAQSGRLRYFLLLGFVCGIAVLNKYSCGVLLVTLFLLSICIKKCRPLWRTPGPWLAGLIFIVLILPHVIWLFQNDFPCLYHIEGRLEERWRWWDPFLTTGAAIYPFAAEAVVLALSARFSSFTRIQGNPDWQTFRRMMILTLPVCVILMLLSFFGKCVILMWFCSLASFTGIAMVAIWPFEIKKEQFRVFYLLLWIFAFTVYIGSAIHLAFTSKERLHTDPQVFLQLGREAWRTAGRTDQIPVIVGDRWYGGVFENYSAEHPQCVEIGEPVALARYKDLIIQKGALLMISDDEQLEMFRKMVKPGSFSIRKVRFRFHSLFGRERGAWFYTGVLQPDGLLRSYTMRSYGK